MFTGHSVTFHIHFFAEYLANDANEYHRLVTHMVFHTIFTMFTHASFPPSQAASITTSRYSVTFPEDCASQAARLLTVISIEPFGTFCSNAK